MRPPDFLGLPALKVFLQEELWRQLSSNPSSCPMTRGSAKPWTRLLEGLEEGAVGQESQTCSSWKAHSIKHAPNPLLIASPQGLPCLPHPGQISTGKVLDKKSLVPRPVTPLHRPAIFQLRHMATGSFFLMQKM